MRLLATNVAVWLLMGVGVVIVLLLDDMDILP